MVAVSIVQRHAAGLCQCWAQLPAWPVATWNAGSSAEVWYVQLEAEQIPNSREKIFKNWEGAWSLAVVAAPC